MIMQKTNNERLQTIASAMQELNSRLVYVGEDQTMRRIPYRAQCERFLSYHVRWASFNSRGFQS